MDSRLKAEVEDAQVIREMPSASVSVHLVTKVRMEEKWEFDGNVELKMIIGKN